MSGCANRYDEAKAKARAVPETRKDTILIAEEVLFEARRSIRWLARPCCDVISPMVSQYVGFGFGVSKSQPTVCLAGDQVISLAVDSFSGNPELSRHLNPPHALRRSVETLKRCFNVLCPSLYLSPAPTAQGLAS